MTVIKLARSALLHYPMVRQTFVVSKSDDCGFSATKRIEFIESFPHIAEGPLLATLGGVF